MLFYIAAWGKGMRGRAHQNSAHCGEVEEGGRGKSQQVAWHTELHTEEGVWQGVGGVGIETGGLPKSLLSPPDPYSHETLIWRG